MDLTRKKPAGGRGKTADPGEDESGHGYLDGQMLIAMPVMEDPGLFAAKLPPAWATIRLKAISTVSC